MTTGTLTRRLSLAAAAVLLAALTGCAADPAPAEPAPSPTASPVGPCAAGMCTSRENDSGRPACDAVADLGNAFTFEIGPNQDAATKAMQSENPIVAEAARVFTADLVEAQNLDGSRRNLAVAQAQLAFLNSCGTAYGPDGPWS